MEIEAKWQLTAPVQPEMVEALVWAPYALGERHTIDQHDTFWDTADLALSRTRHAVRVRDLGSQLLVTLKGPGSVANGVHSREEWEEPTTQHDPSAWPAAIRQRLHDLIGDQNLAPLLDVHNHRRTWALQRDGTTLGEVALDEGTIQAGDQSAPMHELEIELKGGDRSDLAAVADMIQSSLPAQPEDRSKFARGLALAHPQLQRQIDTGDDG